MDVGTDPEDSSQARQLSPDSSEREARRLRAPGSTCPECALDGDVVLSGPELVDGEMVHVTVYRCANGHSWRFPP